MKKIVSTGDKFAVVGPYSQGVIAGDFLFISGQIPIDFETGKIVEGSIEEKAKKVLDNIGKILKAAGCDYSDVVKTTIFVRDASVFPKVNEVYSKYFTKDHPARSFIEVSNLPKGVDIEIEAIAYVKSS